MKVKVCGMCEPHNIADIATLNPDYMGFIFYERSPRFAGKLAPQALDVLSDSTARVGVFVNSLTDYIIKHVEAYGLDYVQLHGDETPEQCKKLKQLAGTKYNFKIIKAMGISTLQDISKAYAYESVCDYLLFDTKTAFYGGSGMKFDHAVLKEYKGCKPYFLSGGIGEEDINIFSWSSAKQCYAVDINSRFEIIPGLKDVEAVKRFIRAVRDMNMNVG